MAFVNKILEKASWLRFGAWFVVLMLFSAWAFNTNSPWTRALEAAGGVLPETKPGIPALEPVRSLEAMGENTGDYLLWQLLDIPYAVMNFMVFATAMALGLKALRLEASTLRFVFLLPAIYVGCELVENAFVASFAAKILPTAEPLVLIQQLATTLKFTSAMPSMALGLLGLVIAAVLGLVRLVRK